MLDIDNFKKFNDFYGHQAGDQALIALSKCLSNLFQRAEDSCFRIGGEEFVVLYKADNIQSSIEYAKVVLHAIEALKIEHLENQPYGHLTSSMGLLLIDSPLQSNDLKEVYKEADELLYQAKSNGRNQVCFKVFLKMST
jgi:diguanylate cyclase (GGDEF)-like protein